MNERADMTLAEARDELVAAWAELGLAIAAVEETPQDADGPELARLEEACNRGERALVYYHSLLRSALS